MKRRNQLFLMVLLALGLQTACENETEYEKQVKNDDKAIQLYLSGNSITATKDPSGIYYEVLEENSGGQVPEENDVITGDYSVKTLDGVSLGNSLSEGPVTFGYQLNRLVPDGLINGTGLMKKGEKFRFYIPSYLAFGSYENESLDANENLIVEFKINEIVSKEDNDTREINMIDDYIDSSSLEGLEKTSDDLYYKAIEPGDGSKPVYGDVIRFNFTRKYLDGTIQEDTDEDPVTVEYIEENFVPGLYEGIGKMNRGETALLIMPSKLGFGASIQVIPQSLKEGLVQDQLLVDPVDPFSPLIYEVELQ